MLFIDYHFDKLSRCLPFRLFYWRFFLDISLILLFSCFCFFVSFIDISLADFLISILWCLRRQICYFIDAIFITPIFDYFHYFSSAYCFLHFISLILFWFFDVLLSSIFLFSFWCWKSYDDILLLRHCHRLSFSFSSFSSFADYDIIISDYIRLRQIFAFTIYYFTLICWCFALLLFSDICFISIMFDFLRLWYVKDILIFDYFRHFHFTIIIDTIRYVFFSHYFFFFFSYRYYFSFSFSLLIFLISLDISSLRMPSFFILITFIFDIIVIFSSSFLRSFLYCLLIISLDFSRYCFRFSLLSDYVLISSIEVVFAVSFSFTLFHWFRALFFSFMLFRDFSSSFSFSADYFFLLIITFIRYFLHICWYFLWFDIDIWCCWWLLLFRRYWCHAFFFFFFFFFFSYDYFSFSLHFHWFLDAIFVFHFLLISMIFHISFPSISRYRHLLLISRYIIFADMIFDIFDYAMFFSRLFIFASSPLIFLFHHDISIFSFIAIIDIIIDIFIDFSQFSSISFRCFATFFFFFFFFFFIDACRHFLFLFSLMLADVIFLFSFQLWLSDVSPHYWLLYFFHYFHFFFDIFIALRHW